VVILVRALRRLLVRVQKSENTIALLYVSVRICGRMQEMKQRIFSFLNDPFIFNNAVYFTGSLAVAALNYLYHPVLSRVLTISNFGDLETIIVIYGQIGVFLGVFGKIVINTIANNSSEEKESVMLRELYTLAIGIIGGVGLLIVAFCLPLTSLFHFSSVYSVLTLALIVLLSIPYTFQSSILIGIQDFKSYSIAAGLQAGGRLLFALIFIWLGFGLQGAIFGLALAQLLSVLFVYAKTRNKFYLRLTHLPHKELFKREVPYAALIFITGACVSIMYNSDIIFVKFFFSPETTGLYSGISVIDNALYFITASVAGVLLPSIKSYETFANNNKTLLKAVGLTFLIGGAVLIVFIAFPDRIIDLMIGAKYISYSRYLPALGIMVFMVSLSNLLISYFMALRKYALIPISICALIVVLISIGLFHGSIWGIVTSFILGSGSLLLLLLAYYVYYFLHEHSSSATA
jgi:O-antigen/teichoic acid export membrane protein